MRHLDYFQSRVIEHDITAPGYLVDITLDAQMFLSSRGDVSLGGVSWAAGELQINSVSSDVAELRIHNPGYKFTTDAMRGAFVRNTVKIYMANRADGGLLPPYVTPGYWPDNYVIQSTTVNPFLIFDGLVSEITDIDEWITVRAVRLPPNRFPRRRLRAPIANFLPASGQVVQWQGETYRIES